MPLHVHTGIVADYRCISNRIGTKSASPSSPSSPSSPRVANRDPIERITRPRASHSESSIGLGTQCPPPASGLVEHHDHRGGVIRNAERNVLGARYTRGRARELPR